MGILDKIKSTSAKDSVEKKEAQAVETKAVVKDAAKKAPTKKAPTKKAAKKAPTKQEGTTSKAYAILKSPLVSEKAAAAETKGQYTFVVSKDADKVAIKDAVESVYGVRPEKVSTMNFDGKTVRFGLRMGRRNAWKKAVVMLPKGKSINIHEGV